ncbi:MAG: 3-deoxy-manno-octulosonate cytidylyltransferase [Candidatus Omnitrophota bacterium]|jgi:3-deoxy-manno-octulosonate cytidylyltransferase (CMP-KDO synthetase)
MKAVGIIPSRLKSTRLPNKALIDIEGLPMVIHVMKRCQLSSALDDVIVATDSSAIMDEVKRHGGKAVMTSSKHNTGTDRIAEVASKLDADIVVNIQGDEPMLDPQHIDAAIKPLLNDKDLQVSVLVTPYKKKNSPSDIKAVLDKEGNILYCSRNDLPSDARSQVDTMLKMCFIVPFRREFLMKYSSWEQTPLEKTEFNEYLRILENGYKIRAVNVDSAHISVDTPEDLEAIRALMKTDKLIKRYMK